MKLCKDCEFMTPDAGLPNLLDYAICGNPSRSPVTGNPIYTICSENRKMFGDCGPDAKLFKAAQSQAPSTGQDTPASAGA